jgi:hypothetical protein
MKIAGRALLAIFCLTAFANICKAQSHHTPDQLDDLQRAINAIRRAQKAGADSPALEQKIIRGQEETKRFTSRTADKSNRELDPGIAYIQALLVYTDAERIHRYLKLTNVYLHNSTQLSDIVDKYDLPTELLPGTDNRRVKPEALTKMWRVASAKLDEANELLRKNYKNNPADLQE